MKRLTLCLGVAITAGIAPGALLMFHSAFNNGSGSPGKTIADAIDALRIAGANIIVDDVMSLNEPWFQDGVAAQAVNVAKAAGIAYFSSAENPLRRDLEQGAVEGVPPWFVRDGSGPNNWVADPARSQGQSIPFAIMPEEVDCGNTQYS